MIQVGQYYFGDSGKVGQFSVGVDTGVPSVLSSRPNSRGLARTS